MQDKKKKLKQRETAFFFKLKSKIIKENHE